MPQLVKNTENDIRENARKVGLIPVDGSLSFGHMPVLRWMGSPADFLQLAHSAGVKLIYLDVTDFHPTEMIMACVAENMEDYPPESGVDTVDQLYRSLEKAVEPWLDREGQPARLSCTWVHEGVAHTWKVEQPWYVECRNAMDQALDEFFEVDEVAAR